LQNSPHDLFELLERVQSSRLDDQRCVLPPYFTQVKHNNQGMVAPAHCESSQSASGVCQGVLCVFGNVMGVLRRRDREPAATAKPQLPNSTELSVERARNQYFIAGEQVRRGRKSDCIMQLQRTKFAGNDKRCRLTLLPIESYSTMHRVTQQPDFDTRTKKFYGPVRARESAKFNGPEKSTKSRDIINHAMSRVSAVVDGGHCSRVYAGIEHVTLLSVSAGGNGT
ncbi:hypothetical protein L9F63_011336, partial [Diploptera punctata]